MPNSSPSTYFPHNSNPARWIGLRDSDWPNVTQATFMFKVGLELTASWFLEMNVSLHLISRRFLKVQWLAGGTMTINGQEDLILKFIKWKVTTLH